MRLSGWHLQAVMALFLGCFLGCALPPLENPPLTAAAAQQTLDRWNPSYCKVVEFYGFYKPGQSDARVAYVLLTNPSGAAPKQTVYEARFQLLTRSDGQQQWFLTSLLSHSAGLSRRQGWDNLLIPVPFKAEAAGK
jgi:hypothetical protein